MVFQLDELRVPGTNRMFCPACSKCLELSAFDPGFAYCRICLGNRTSVERIRQFSADRRIELLAKLIHVLERGQTPDRAIGTRAKESVRDVAIRIAAEDRDFRDCLLADLQMLRDKQTCIPSISATQDIEDVRNRNRVNI